MTLKLLISPDVFRFWIALWFSHIHLRHLRSFHRNFSFPFLLMPFDDWIIIIILVVLAIFWDQFHLVNWQKFNIYMHSNIIMKFHDKRFHTLMNNSNKTNERNWQTFIFPLLPYINVAINSSKSRHKTWKRHFIDNPNIRFLKCRCLDRDNFHAGAKKHLNRKKWRRGRRKRKRTRRKIVHMNTNKRHNTQQY